MTNTASDLSKIIHDLEDQIWRALQSSGSALLPYCSDDCIMQFPMGLKLTNRSEPSLRDVMLGEGFVPWKSYSMTDVDVIPCGAAAALICYKVEAYRPAANKEEHDVKFVALVSSAWRRDEEEAKWLLCFHQQTLC